MANLDQITHCIVQAKLALKVDLVSYAEKGIPCLQHQYLKEYILREEKPDEADLCLSEYKTVMLNLAG